LNARQSFGRIQGFPYIRAALRVEPEVRGVAEDSTQDESCIRCESATDTAEFIDVLSWQTRFFGQLGLSQTERLHELFDEYLANTYGLSFCD